MPNISPDDFKRSIEVILEQYAPRADWEATHGRFDDLMEEILIQHGYSEGVELIREYPRWYA